MDRFFVSGWKASCPITMLKSAPALADPDTVAYETLTGRSELPLNLTVNLRAELDSLAEASSTLSFAADAAETTSSSEK